MAHIVFTQGPYAGHRLPLPEGGILLGRGQQADLVIDDPRISNAHAQLRIENGAWCLFDLKSSNGTTVNGHAIEAVQMNEGDVVAAGDTQFVFTVEASPAEMPSPLPTPPPETSLPSQVEVVQEAPAGHVAISKDLEAQFSTEVTEEDVQFVKQMSGLTDAMHAEVGEIIVGQSEVLDQILVCIIAGGHAILIGPPGLAETLALGTIAKVLDMKFRRMQFTPDLVPTDIIGAYVLETDRETGEKQFRFVTGPIFCNLLLVDEINLSPPKTKAALIEAMQKRYVTAGNTTCKLDRPFFVLATQSLIEQEGIHPLPQAQQDCFMFNIWMDYPLQAEEEKIITATMDGRLAEPRCILTKDQVLQLQSIVRKVPVSDPVVKYVVKLVRSTRQQYEEAPEITRKYLSYGAGPSAGQNLLLAAKAMAVLEGRLHVSCNDIRRAAIPVLRHRIRTNSSADAEGLKSADIIKALLNIVTEPGSEAYSAPGQATPTKGDEK